LQYKEKGLQLHLFEPMLTQLSNSKEER